MIDFNRTLAAAADLLDNMGPIIAQDLRWIIYARKDKPIECRKLLKMAVNSCHSRGEIHSGGELKEAWQLAYIALCRAYKMWSASISNIPPSTC